MGRRLPRAAPLLLLAAAGPETGGYGSVTLARLLLVYSSIRPHHIVTAFVAGAGVQGDVQGHAFRGAFLHDKEVTVLRGGRGACGRGLGCG